MLPVFGSGKSTEKRQIWGTPSAASGSWSVFACRPALKSRQISGFFCSFSDVFIDFSREVTEKGLKWTKKFKNDWNKVVQPAFGCVQHPKAGQNTQQLWSLFLGVFILNIVMVFTHIGGFKQHSCPWYMHVITLKTIPAEERQE